MKYSVVAEDGRCLGGAAVAAGAERGDTKGREGGGQGLGDGCALGGAAVREFLSGRKDSDMLRMANQSIFADMLEVRVLKVRLGHLDFVRSYLAVFVCCILQGWIECLRLPRAVCLIAVTHTFRATPYASALHRGTFVWYRSTMVHVFERGSSEVWSPPKIFCVVFIVVTTHHRCVSRLRS